MKYIQYGLMFLCIFTLKNVFAENDTLHLFNGIYIPSENVELATKIEQYYTAIVKNDFVEASNFIYMNDNDPEKKIFSWGAFIDRFRAKKIFLLQYLTLNDNMMLVFGVYEGSDIHLLTKRDDGSMTFRNLSFADVWFKNINDQWVTLPLELIIRKDLKNKINDHDYGHLKKMFVSEESLIHMRAERDTREEELQKKRDVRLKEFMQVEIIRRSEQGDIEMKNINNKENGVKNTL